MAETNPRRPSTEEDDDELNGGTPPVPTPAPRNNRREVPATPGYVNINSLASPDVLRILIPSLTSDAAVAIFNNRDVAQLDQLKERVPGVITDKTLEALRGAKLIAVPSGGEQLKAVPVDKAETPKEKKEAKEKQGLWRSLGKGIWTFTSPIFPNGKGKVGYALGIALGAGRFAFTAFPPLGIPYTLGLDAAAYGTSFIMEKIKNARMKKMNEVEKAAYKARYEWGPEGFVNGLCAGYAATSVAKIASTAVIAALPSVGEKVVQIGKGMETFGQNVIRHFTGYNDAKMAQDTMEIASKVSHGATEVVNNPPGVLADVKQLALNTKTELWGTLSAAGFEMPHNIDSMRLIVDYNEKIFNQLDPTNLQYFHQIAGTSVHPQALELVGGGGGADVIQEQTRVFNQLIEAARAQHSVLSIPDVGLKQFR